MKRTKRKILALLGATLVLLCTFMLSGFTRATRVNYNGVKKIYDKNVNNYSNVGVKIGATTLSDKALLIHDTTYVTLRSFSDALARVDISYNPWQRQASVLGEGLLLTATDGAYVVEANGRTLFAMTPVVIMDDGKMYVPIRTLAKAYGVSVAWDDATRSVSIRGNVNYLEHADSFYDKDELYWLSRIISAESRGEPFKGQIAVGNVILNRTGDGSFPDTVYGVIFDRKFGTQFTPAATGSVYNDPTASAVRAAKVVLEGVEVVGDALFFCAKRVSKGSWMDNNRQYIETIGNHVFYY